MPSPEDEQRVARGGATAIDPASTASHGWSLRARFAAIRNTRPGRTARPVLLFTAVLVSLAASGYVGVVRNLPRAAANEGLPWWVLAVGFLLVESKVIQVHFRRETHSFSLSEVPAVIGLFYASPDAYLAALLVGSSISLLLGSRDSPVKFLFNLANFALIGVVQVSVFHLLAPHGGTLSTADWLAGFAAMLAVVPIGAITIAAAISLSGGAPQFQKLPEMLRFGGMVAIANTSLALLGVALLQVEPDAVWLLVVPIGVVFLAYRAYVSEREKHERLELLYQSSRILQHSPELDSALIALLDHARAMFRAELAEVLLDAREQGRGSLRTTSIADARAQVMVPGGSDEWQAAVRTSRASFVEGPLTHPAGLMVRQAMTVPLIGESGTFGALVVANRLTQGTSFAPDDLRLLETVANQTAVALENGQLEQSLAELSRLKEELRHQAYHDSLTGLPNRQMLTEAVDERLQASGETIVLFLDLDDFKLVNDTLGHQAGDRLLAVVADRVKGCIRLGDTAARLGGDEFAIVLDPEADMDLAVVVATRLVETLALPFQVFGHEIVVGASIGIASANGTEARGEELLRNADVAMYRAKSEGKGRVAVFDPSMHAALLARHQLSSDLSRSLGRGELAVAYQPIVDLVSGRTIGFEALMRWRHPTRGMVLPDEFIPLAEESGAILPLGRWILTEAAAQCAAWVRLGNDGGPAVSVNVSPHQLQQSDFTAEVERVLEATGLPPDRLILEVTETAMFQDTEATIPRLQALRARGIRIALDDFGTGYSSLGYLRRFPVDILKIARDFVVDADGSAGEWAFAHAIVALGQTLGLRIVAEGIETQGQVERLSALGCELGQGFHLGRPADAETIGMSLRAAIADGAGGGPDRMAAAKPAAAAPAVATPGAAIA